MPAPHQTIAISQLASAHAMNNADSYTVNRRAAYTFEWQSSGQVWVAYYCGCSECPKGTGKTQDEAMADLEEQVNAR
jgi:hypothetical protein